MYTNRERGRDLERRPSLSQLWPAFREEHRLLPRSLSAFSSCPPSPIHKPKKKKKNQIKKKKKIVERESVCVW